MDLFTATPSEKILTVSQLTRRVKDVLERQVGALWVAGEISNYRLQSSGHHYFTLKDAAAQLSCVMFKSSAQSLRIPLGDGLMVQAFGEITVYEARGQYQMLVRKVQAAGQGALQMRFEELKRRLAAEGLFDAAHKKPLPRFPRTVAVVTSPTGAALQDMLHVLRRRAPWLRLLIAPVRVQGAGAEQEIAGALRMLAAESGRALPEIDAVVVARGGGSLEDLWCFNEEAVARAIYECPIPVISAVGHEIDFTIADFTADLRAPTPSAAAELLTPDRAELLSLLAQHRERMEFRVLQWLAAARRIVELTGRSVLQRDGERLLLPCRQRLDGAVEDCQRQTLQKLQVLNHALQSLRHRLELKRPDRLLAERTAALEVWRDRLCTRALAALERRNGVLERLSGLLRTLGPPAVLERGYSLTSDSSGKLVREASQLQPGEEFTTRFRRGQLDASVLRVRDA